MIYRQIIILWFLLHFHVLQIYLGKIFSLSILSVTSLDCRILHLAAISFVLCIIDISMFFGFFRRSSFLISSFIFWLGALNFSCFSLASYPPHSIWALSAGILINIFHQGNAQNSLVYSSMFGKIYFLSLVTFPIGLVPSICRWETFFSFRSLRNTLSNNFFRMLFNVVYIFQNVDLDYLRICVCVCFYQ